VSDIVEEVMPSIVSITNISLTEYQSFWGGQTQTYQSESAGSGIIVSQDDTSIYIATNNHVVDGATSLTVTFYDDSTVSAEVQGTYASTDLAVLRVDLTSIESDTLPNIKVAALGDSDALKVGEASIAIGNALGYGQSVTTGCISALNREVSVTDSSTNTSYTAELIQTDAAINPGNSGGALLNAKGEVIGINSVKYASTSVEGIGYAIPINTALPIITNIITKQSSGTGETAYLGIGGVDVTSSVAQSYNMPQGVYVRKVFSGTAAETAGIREGDIITKVDGTTVSTSSELTDRIQMYSAGDTVDIVVERVENGVYVEETISVTLGKKQ
jgi:serine protease Do